MLLAASEPRAHDRRTGGAREDLLDGLPQVPRGSRSFDLEALESIVRNSSERYHDAQTGRIVGRHDKQLVVIPCDVHGDLVTPVTVHAITRQQIRFRLRTGRFGHA